MKQLLVKEVEAPTVPALIAQINESVQALHLDESLTQLEIISISHTVLATEIGRFIWSALITAEAYL